MKKDIKTKEEKDYDEWFKINWKWVKTKKHSDLKTDEDFDRWYGRKPGWKDCFHRMEDYRDGNPLCEIYRVQMCVKCGMQERH